MTRYRLQVENRWINGVEQTAQRTPWTVIYQGEFNKHSEAIEKARKVSRELKALDHRNDPGYWIAEIKK